MTQEQFQSRLRALFALSIIIILGMNTMLFMYFIWREKPSVETQEICMSVHFKNMPEQEELETPTINPTT
jgi:hypothetical protein